MLLIAHYTKERERTFCKKESFWKTILANLGSMRVLTAVNEAT